MHKAANGKFHRGSDDDPCTAARRNQQGRVGLLHDNCYRFAWPFWRGIVYATLLLGAHAAIAGGAGDPNPHPVTGYERLGIDIGGFQLLPDLDVGEIYDDNIFAAPRNATGDSYTELKPAFLVQSKWDQNSLSLNASSTIRKYANTKTQDTEEYDILGEARLDVGHAISITASAEDARRVDTRGTSGNTFTTGKPITYDLKGASIGFKADLARVSFSGSANVTGYGYNDFVNQDVRTDQSFRNRTLTTLDGQAGYLVSGTLQIFAAGTLTLSRYQQQTDFDRSGKTYSGFAGLDFGTVGLIQGFVSIGYIRQTFELPGFAAFSGINYRAGLRWYPTTLLTVRLDASRTPTSSSIATVAAVLTSHANVQADYQLLRNLLVSPQLGYESDIYEHYGREDRRLSGGISVRRAFNRLMSVAAGWTTIQQSSSGPARGSAYNDNRLSVTLSLTK